MYACHFFLFREPLVSIFFTQGATALEYSAALAHSDAEYERQGTKGESSEDYWVAKTRLRFNFTGSSHLLRGLTILGPNVLGTRDNMNMYSSSSAGRLREIIPSLSNENSGGFALPRSCRHLAREVPRTESPRGVLIGTATVFLFWAGAMRSSSVVRLLMRIFVSRFSFQEDGSRCYLG